MKLSTKIAMLGLMGATFAVPAISQADALKINLLGLHISIGHNRPDDCWDWRWRRDHGYDDWRWYRDHPGYRGDRDDHRDERRDRGNDRRDNRDNRGRRDDRGDGRRGRG